MTSNTLREIPSDVDIPLQVQVPTAPSLTTGKGGGDSSANNKPEEVDGEELVRAVLKYSTADGREAILAVAKTVHHDFGPFNQSLAVSLSSINLDSIKSNPHVDWFEGDGRVIYCSIR
eukprot:CAMPEP_0181087050 /NCGR_PEP_ID=MMETSP1071-20121207/6070_1 /TAXON_ID=35127 /ORGANISM="Thalassiosira sp., Strain NH16" /LENGTH=117 /DNA_ID=CAMNT_0023168921 /DNA_START=39 /DNA_END=392 /DNA_ORIENTATION=+